MILVFSVVAKSELNFGLFRIVESACVVNHLGLFLHLERHLLGLCGLTPGRNQRVDSF